MAYFYVKDGGQATGDQGRYATKQTGPLFAGATTGYYDSQELAEVATTNPVDGDFMLASDLHIHTQSGAYQSGIAGVNYICVDDANVENYRTSGNRSSITVTGSGDVQFHNSYTAGGHFISADNGSFNGSARVEDIVIEVTGSTDICVSSGSDGNALEMIDCELATRNSGALLFNISAGSELTVKGGFASTSAGTGLITNASNGGMGNGGGAIYLEGFDLSIVSDTLFANIGGSAVSDDKIDIRLDLCKIRTGVAFTNEEFKSLSHRFIATRCSDSSATAEYQYYLQGYGGVVTDDTSTYRNEDEAFTESNQKISYEIDTNADPTEGRPFWFDFPLSNYAKLSATATDAIRFYLTCADTLTNKDIHISVTYPDGTNKQDANRIQSGPQTTVGTFDIMADGVELTDDVTSTWTGGLTNKYQITLDTSVNAGADSIPTIRIYVSKPDVIINIASEFGLS